MPSVFVIKSGLENPRDWYNQRLNNAIPWEYDKILKAYHTGSVYLFQDSAGYAVFEDVSESGFFGWPVESWLELAGDLELLYTAITAKIPVRLNLSTFATANAFRNTGNVTVNLK